MKGKVYTFNQDTGEKFDLVKGIPYTEAVKIAWRRCADRDQGLLPVVHEHPTRDLIVCYNSTRLAEVAEVYEENVDAEAA